MIPCTAEAGLGEQIRRVCEQKLADFKVPRAVYMVRELPRSTLNKINKRELRNVAAAGADRETAESRWLSQAALDPSGDLPARS